MFPSDVNKKQHEELICCTKFLQIHSVQRLELETERIHWHDIHMHTTTL